MSFGVSVFFVSLHGRCDHADERRRGRFQPTLMAAVVGGQERVALCAGAGIMCADASRRKCQTVENGEENPRRKCGLLVWTCRGERNAGNPWNAALQRK